MSHYLTEPINVNVVSDVSTEVTQGEHFATANNLLNESVGAFILRARPASIVSNISNVSILNNGALPVTITSAAGTIPLSSGAALNLGTGIRKINNLSTITLGAINSFTIMWSELDA